MRELKFRCWDNRYNKYRRIHLMYPIPSGKLVVWLRTVPCNDWEVITEEDGVVEQYIGVKDKNGKEIYEGDIVKFKYKHYDTEGSIVKQVKWSVWINGVKGKKCVGFFNVDSKMEVIGNIHENGDLLGKY